MRRARGDKYVGLGRARLPRDRSSGRGGPAASAAGGVLAAQRWGGAAARAPRSFKLRRFSIDADATLPSLKI